MRLRLPEPGRVVMVLAALLAAAFVSPMAASAADSAGPDRPGPDRPRSTPVRAPSTGVRTAFVSTCSGFFDAVLSANNAGDNYLYGDAAIDPSDVWAVGTWVNSSNYDQSLAEHWNGAAWSVSTTPNVGASHNDLFAVSAASSTDVWAVGLYTNVANANRDATLAEHWNGSAWTHVATPNGPGGGRSDLFGVSAVASNDVWAVGQYVASGKNRTLIEHWNGVSWKIVASPNAGTSNNQLFAMSALSATDIWAVGYYRPSAGAMRKPLAQHWDGTSWTVKATTSIGYTGDVELQAVTALAAGQAVAVGEGSPTSVDVFKAMQFDLGLGAPGPTFAISTGIDAAILYGSAASGGKVWAVGFKFDSSRGDLLDTIVASAYFTSGPLPQLTLGGSDSPGFEDNVLYAVTAASPTTFWAVGYQVNLGVVHTSTELSCRPKLVLTAPASATTGAGFSLTVTATLWDSSTATNYVGTVHFTSGDSQAVLPADYTFTGGDAGSHTFTGVMLKTPYQQTIAARDTLSSEITGSTTVTVACLGACQGPGGTSGDRTTIGAPVGAPGPRVAARPRLAIPAALPKVHTPAPRTTSPHRTIAAAPASAPHRARVATLLAATHPEPGAMPAAAPAPVTQRMPGPTEPGRAPWYLLLFLPVLVTASALVVRLRRLRA